MFLDDQKLQLQLIKIASELNMPWPEASLGNKLMQPEQVQIEE